MKEESDSDADADAESVGKAAKKKGAKGSKAKSPARDFKYPIDILQTTPSLIGCILCNCLARMFHHVPRALARTEPAKYESLVSQLQALPKTYVY